MARIDKHPILEIPESKKVVRFFFNGKELTGYENEAVSSALIANGIHEFSIHKRGDIPQGIFCANGQCSHCTVIIDGFPQKSCVTPLKENMDIWMLKHLPELPRDARPLDHFHKIEIACDVLVVGGGPSGLTASIELAKLGFSVILVDDKAKLGGKLLLQTHKFFGSIEDCYAGMRGVEIATLLEKEVRSFQNITVFTDSSVVGIFKDQKAGIFVNNRNYVIAAFQGLLVSAGAREKMLIFPGNNLPGVYGAGAFQTLVNRDLIHSSDRIFIIGSGNVGLISAYHALQAGITAVGICDILPKVSGYNVHADKIKRMGVPIYLNHTIVSAEGDGKVEKITIAEVDESFQPILSTAKTFAVDTLLIAVGLTPVDEFFETAKKFGFKVVSAGDANEIAEASSAMFDGRIVGLQIAQLLGKEIDINPSYMEKAEILKSKRGRIFKPENVVLDEKFRPIIRCDEEIPCNPCISICPINAIQLKSNLGNILDIPTYIGGCTGCAMCVLICPGLAITLARKINYRFAEVVLPHEYILNFKIGDWIPLVDEEGNYLENGKVLKIRLFKKFKTHLITVKTTLNNGAKVAGIRIQSMSVTESLSKPSFNYIPENGVVCHCEMVTLKELVTYIREHHVRDINQLKQIRVGMGACGGKTCSEVLPQVFKVAGVDWKEVAPGSKRPLSVEVPMSAIINEKDGE